MNVLTLAIYVRLTALSLSTLDNNVVFTYQPNQPTNLPYQPTMPTDTTLNPVSLADNPSINLIPWVQFTNRLSQSLAPELDEYGIQFEIADNPLWAALPANDTGQVDAQGHLVVRPRPIFPPPIPLPANGGTAAERDIYKMVDRSRKAYLRARRELTTAMLNSIGEANRRALPLPTPSTTPPPSPPLPSWLQCLLCMERTLRSISI